MIIIIRKVNDYQPYQKLHRKTKKRSKSDLMRNYPKRETRIKGIPERAGS